MTRDGLPCECGHARRDHAEDGACDRCGCDWWFGLQPIHTVDHDPTLDHERCETCNVLLRRALVRLADRIMGPRDADELMAAIRAELAEVA